MSWELKIAQRTRSVIYWPGEEVNWENPAKIRGGNPVLFPFVGRTFADGVIGSWKSPEGDVRPMQQHGYARAGAFRLAAIDEEGFTARFMPCEACQAAYPYQYEFDVVYRFSELSIQVDFRLKNEGDKQIPWAAGHHFYFALPWHAGLGREHYRIHIPAKKAFYHGADGRLEPIRPFLDKAPFNDPAIVDRLHTKLTQNRVTFGPDNGEESIGISWGETTVPQPWNTLVTWTEGEDSPFYCVEPWMGPPNSPTHQKGLHYVEPGKSETFSTEITLL